MAGSAPADHGATTETGHFKIIGHLNEQFKTAKGKRVTPTLKIRRNKVEEIYADLMTYHMPTPVYWL